ncbi:HNH endonuclease [Pseudomonas germanica]|uniref:HNH endonuclease n=1 Tax=Pseudomonas germanica TaxID=2815720 RepID=A0ABX8YSU7_9PSED|nr:hypothetical protein [Pseudomonas germanica]QYY82974.1 hypothetical protein J0G10_05845 [Pseudomonas germanica]
MAKVTYSFNEVFDACVLGRRRIALTPDEEKLKVFLRGSHKVFKLHCQLVMCHLYPEQSSRRGVGLPAYLNEMYEDKLAAKNTAGRFYYEKLRALAPDKKCQICHHGDVYSLDHYLPKKFFPSLSISAFNLIPSCFPCNGKKLTYVPRSPGEQTIHPRFDNFYDGDWLQADYVDSLDEVVFRPNVILYPEKSINYARIAKHLAVHGLHELYETLAMREVRRIVSVSKQTGEGLEELLKLELTKIKDNSRGFNKSMYTFEQWKVATCRALLASNRFLNGGVGIFGRQSQYVLPDHDFT